METRMEQLRRMWVTLDEAFDRRGIAHAGVAFAKSPKVIRDFNENLDPAQKSVRLNDLGNTRPSTNAARALSLAEKMHARLGGPGKITVVICDGEECVDGMSARQAQAALRRKIAKLESKGHRVLGVGLGPKGAELVPQIYSDWIRVPDAQMRGLAHAIGQALVSLDER
jgi:hypothetical protein